MSDRQGRQSRDGKRGHEGKLPGWKGAGTAQARQARIRAGAVSKDGITQVSNRRLFRVTFSPRGVEKNLLCEDLDGTSGYGRAVGVIMPFDPH